MRTRPTLLVLLLAMGCGDDGGGVVDGGRDDAGVPDATSLDAELRDAAPLGQANVTTFSRCCVGSGQPGERVGGVEIIVSNPDGSITTTETDSNGEATIELSPGASVTAYYGDAGSETALASFLGVQPGDELVFGKTWLADEASIGQMTFNWPPDATIERVDVYTACGNNWGDGSDGTSSKLFYPSCASAPADVIFVGRDANGVMRWGVVADQPFVANGTVTLPAWEQPATLTLSTTGLPVEVIDAMLYAAVTLGGRETYNAVEISGTPTAGELAATVPWAPMGESLRVYGRYAQLPLPAAGGTPGVHHVIVTTTADATAVTIADPITMPWMSAVVVAPATDELSWSFEGEGVWDATRIEVFYNRKVPNVGFEYFRWTVILPPDLDEATLPALPASLEAKLSPRPGDGFYVSGALYDLGDVQGYDEARQQPEWHFSELYWIGAVPDDLIKISGGPFYE